MVSLPGGKGKNEIQGMYLLDIFYLPSTLRVMLDWYTLHSKYWEVHIINGKTATHKGYISFQIHAHGGWERPRRLPSIADSIDIAALQVPCQTPTSSPTKSRI